MKKAILLYSGGMDSTILLYKLLNEGTRPICLGIDYGQKHVKELKYASLHCGIRSCAFIETKCDLSFLHTGLVTTKEITDAESSITPNRNMIFLSLAISLAVKNEADTIYLSAHKGDYKHYLDCRPDFINVINDSIMASTGRAIRVEAPFIDMTKQEIYMAGLKLRVPIEDTWSCYNGGNEPCGTCAACIERNKL
jgi:7-cyano-7-deazaguanine synthase